MADFCKQCSVQIFGEDCGDLADLITEEQFKYGIVAVALCEGCGPTKVDHEGRCVCAEHKHITEE